MILVTGATGNVGREVVGALVDSGYEVRALVRAGKETTLPATVEPVAGDLNRPDSLSAALSGASAMFLLPGYEELPGTLARARDAGVARVVLLSGQSAGQNPELTNAITRYMVQSERAVTGSGIPWTIIRPSAFMSNALRWLPQLRAGDVIREPFGHVRVAAIDPFDIGAVAALALTTTGHEGRHYPVSGPESLLPAERVEILARVLGRPLRFEPLTNDEARAQMSATTPAEYVDAFFRFYVDGTLDESQVLPTVEQLTGRPPRTFTQWATTHIDAFR
jgi:uncharacterized protein YbjT (DUF2867 family)